jgi:dTDP-4-amino-4,6-dideoxygalactose transaminase
MLDLKLEYLHMKAEIDAAIARCLDHQQWILGPEVKELETKIAAYLGVKHCIGASSGTEALVLSLRALAVKRTGNEYFTRNDLVITTPFTFTATGDAILRSGATPIFVDIDPATFNMDPAAVLACADAHRGQVVGIVPVHLYGRACDMDKLGEVAKRDNLFVVEDIAQAFGGSWKGKRLGSIGDTGAFSFFPSKNLGGFGDGGLVSTNDDKLAELVRMLLKHGGRDKYNVDHIGYNARLDTLQAAVLVAKFGFIEDFNARRVALAKAYNRDLAGTPGITLPEITEGHVAHQYTIRVAGGRRDAVQKQLGEAGVSTMVYYPFPLHKMKVFGEGRSRSCGTLTHAEAACEQVLSLPVEPLMTAEGQAMVLAAVKAAAR